WPRPRGRMARRARRRTAVPATARPGYARADRARCSARRRGRDGGGGGKAKMAAVRGGQMAQSPRGLFGARMGVAEADVPSGARVMRSRFKILCAVLALCLGAGAALAAAPEPDDPWPDLARDIFKGRPLLDGKGLISIEMPYRAEDAAI